MMKLVKYLLVICVSLATLSCKPKEEKFFSVIIPAYNREKFLPRALDSVLSQDYNNYEIIVIDDGSTDNTIEIMNKYLAKNKQIRFLINDKNMGVSYSRNRGIDEAKGEFVTFLDSDDIFLDDFFEETNKAIFENTDAVFFTPWTRKMWNDFKPKGHFNKFDTFLDFSLHNPVSTSGTTIKKDYLINNNLKFDTNHNITEDYDLWAKIYIKNAKMIVIKKYLVAIERGMRGFYPIGYGTTMRYRDIVIRKKVREYLSKDKKILCSIFTELVENKDERFSLKHLKQKKKQYCKIENKKLKNICQQNPDKCFVLYHPFFNVSMMLNEKSEYCKDGEQDCGKITSRTDKEIHFEWEDGFKEIFYKLDKYPNSYYAD